MVKFSEIPYKRIDMDAVIAELKELAVSMKNAKTAEEALEVHLRYTNLSGHLDTMGTIAMIRNDADISDPFYKAEQEFYDEAVPKGHPFSVEYQKQLYYSPFRTELEEKLGKVAFKNIELAMQSVDEKIVPLIQEANRLAREYNELIASAKIDWDGEVFNLSLLTPYLNSSDADVRKRAWDKYTEFFVQNQKKIEEIYDALVKNRTEQGRQMGHENFIPLGYARMQRNCYTREDIAFFREQVKKYIVPLATRLHERKKERLGLDELTYREEAVFFAEGNPAPTGDAKQIMQSGLKMYKELSKETDAFMTAMTDGEFFDVFGRKNKRDGGYQAMLWDYHMPFVFANFNGSYTDIDVITHECGHAFQAFVTADYPIREHNDITMETAEIHSMSMEFFTEPWMEMFFGERAGDYRAMHLESAICFIPYGTMVDEFQDIIYANPDMTPAERNAVWSSLEKQYKPHLNYPDNTYFLEGGFWQNKQHIFNMPFYYIDYCIAQMCALQYKIWMEKDFEAAWKSYTQLCKLSATDFFFGLLSKSGLKNPFEKNCIRDIAEELEARL